MAAQAVMDQGVDLNREVMWNEMSNAEAAVEYATAATQRATAAIWAPPHPDPGNPVMSAAVFSGLYAWVPETKVAAFTICAETADFELAVGMMTAAKDEVEFDDLTALTFLQTTGGYDPENTVRDGDVVEMERVGNELRIRLFREPTDEYSINVRRWELPEMVANEDLNALMVLDTDLAEVGDIIIGVNGIEYNTVDELQGAIATAFAAVGEEGFITLDCRPLGGNFATHYISPVPIDGHLAVCIAKPSMKPFDGIVAWVAVS